MIPLIIRRLAGYSLRRLHGLSVYRRITRVLPHLFNIGLKEADEGDMQKFHSWSNPRAQFKYSYNPKVVNFVAKKGGSVIGFIQLVDRSEERNGLYKGFWLHSLSVKTIYQGMGLGDILTQRVILTAKEKGAYELCLTVREDNYRAINLYRKKGFERMIITEIESKLEKQRLPSGERCIFMRKILKEPK